MNLGKGGNSVELFFTSSGQRSAWHLVRTSFLYGLDGSEVAYEEIRTRWDCEAQVAATTTDSISD